MSILLKFLKTNIGKNIYIRSKERITDPNICSILKNNMTETLKNSDGLKKLTFNRGNKTDLRSGILYLEILVRAKDFDIQFVHLQNKTSLCNEALFIKFYGRKLCYLHLK